MRVKFKTTADGEMAILPRAEFERLKALAQEALEDAGTARLVARARKEIAGGAPLLPRALVEQLAGGSNPIRTLRQFRGWSQVELATSVGIGQNYLSDLETGKRKGPLALHAKFAKALGVPLDLLTTIAVSEEQSAPARTARRRRVFSRLKMGLIEMEKRKRYLQLLPTMPDCFRCEIVFEMLDVRSSRLTSHPSPDQFHVGATQPGGVELLRSRAL